MGTTDVSDQPFRTTTPSTRPELPQDRRNRSPWPWLAFSFIILAAVYLLREPSVPQTMAEPIPAEPAAHTVVVEVNAVLSIPTEIPTPIPTLYPTAAATADVSLNWCSNKTPRAGDTCQMPPAPTPTEAQRPECPAAPSVWCVFPATDETNGELHVN